jgi:hypothetical protein
MLVADMYSDLMTPWIVVFFLWGILIVFRSLEAEAKKRSNQKLLEQNPEAWAMQKRLEMEQEERKRGQLGSAAKTGLGIAMRFLKKK